MDSKGRSGGLCLLWKDPFEVDITSYSPGHIDCLVKHDDYCWHFTGFYGNPDASLRNSSWTLMRRLADMHEYLTVPCLIGRDFNEICYDSEKLGGNKRPASQMEAFWNMINDCNLQSLHSEGDLFTWVNRRQSEGLIFERLDRFMSSFDWRMLFPISRCSTLDFYHSDHRPIYIDFRPSGSLNQLHSTPSATLFRFEAMWSREEECEQ